MSGHPEDCGYWRWQRILYQARILLCHSPFAFLLGEKIQYFLHESAEKKESEKQIRLSSKLERFYNVALSKNKKHYKENNFCWRLNQWEFLLTHPSRAADVPQLWADIQYKTPANLPEPSINPSSTNMEVPAGTVSLRRTTSAVPRDLLTWVQPKLPWWGRQERKLKTGDPRPAPSNLIQPGNHQGDIVLILSAWVYFSSLAPFFHHCWTAWNSLCYRACVIAVRGIVRYLEKLLESNLHWMKSPGAFFCPHPDFRCSKPKPRWRGDQRWEWDRNQFFPTCLKAASPPVFLA